MIEPNLHRELFIYRDQSTKLNSGSSTDLIPSSYSSGQVPITSPLTNTFDNSYIDARNSFHWGKLQFEGLSTTFRNSWNLDDLTTNDYNIALMKHWLRRTNNDAYVTDTLSMMRNPSPNKTNEGQKVWFDYKGKSGAQAWSRGTNSSPCFQAVVLPDGNTRFKYIEQNRWGHPTLTTTTYSSNSVVAHRSMSFTYATNEIDLITARGPSNELLSSNAYNSVHQVLTNYNAVNDMTTFTYDSAGRLTSLRSPTGLTSTNIYYTPGSDGPAGWLYKTIDIEISRTNTFGFDFYSGELLWQIHPLGLVVSHVRDSMNRVIETHTLDLNLTNVWDRLGIASTSINGTTNRYTYDEMQRMYLSVDPRNNTNGVKYCGCGFILRITNAVNSITRFDHDWVGQRTKTTLPDEQTTLTWNYDLLGQATNINVVGVSSVTNYFNNQGLLSVSSNALGLIESYQYDIYDRPTNVTHVNGITVQTTYDLLGRTLTRTYPDGGVEKYAYSAAGVTLHTNQLGKVTKYGYDVAGRLTAATNANNEVTRYVYDCEGNMTELIDGKNQTNAFTFDVYSRLIRQTNAARSLVLTNGYDLQGNLTKRWTPAKGLTTFAYDQSGNVTNINYPSSPDISFTYDGINQVSTMIDGIGTTTYTYNENGELEAEDGPWEYDTVSYSYTNGLRQAMTVVQPNGKSKFSYGYDTVSRLSSITAPSGTFGYAYQTTDASNGKGSLIKKLSMPNGSYITNTFNNMGQLLSTYLKSSTHATLNSHAYTYNTGAQRTKQTRTGGDYVNYTYDDLGQLRTATARESGGLTDRLNEQFYYGYDAAGNLQFRTNTYAIQTFSVDSLNQISSVTRSGPYDPVKGVSSTATSSLTVNGNAATTYADNTSVKYVVLANGVNTLTALGADSLGRGATNVVVANLPTTVNATYDSNGNLLIEGDRRYSYDDENQLIAFGFSSATSTNVYAYDGRNRRRVRTDFITKNGGWVKAAEIRYIYDGNLMIQERNGDNLPLTTYTRGLDLSGSLEGAGGIGGLLARTDHSLLGRTDYYHQEGNGNVTCLADNKQGVAAQYTYDPFGRVIARSGPVADANRLQFSGKESDSGSGLSYYGLRFYNPAMQRWQNQDPLGLGRAGNSFRAMANDGINTVDPFGLLEWSVQIVSDRVFYTNHPIPGYFYDPFTGRPLENLPPVLAPGATSQELQLWATCTPDSKADISGLAFSSIRVLTMSHPFYRTYVPKDPTVRPYFFIANQYANSTDWRLRTLASTLRFMGVVSHEQKHQRAFVLLLAALKTQLEKVEAELEEFSHDWVSCFRTVLRSTLLLETQFDWMLSELNNQIEETGTFSKELIATFPYFDP